MIDRSDHAVKAGLSHRQPHCDYTEYCKTARPIISLEPVHRPRFEPIQSSMLLYKSESHWSEYISTKSQC